MDWKLEDLRVGFWSFPGTSLLSGLWVPPHLSGNVHTPFSCYRSFFIAITSLQSWSWRPPSNSTNWKKGAQSKIPPKNSPHPASLFLDTLTWVSWLLKNGSTYRLPSHSFFELGFQVQFSLCQWAGLAWRVEKQADLWGHCVASPAIPAFWPGNHRVIWTWNQ